MPHPTRAPVRAHTLTHPARRFQRTVDGGSLGWVGTFPEGEAGNPAHTHRRYFRIHQPAPMPAANTNGDSSAATMSSIAQAFCTWGMDAHSPSVRFHPPNAYPLSGCHSRNFTPELMRNTLSAQAMAFLVATSWM